VAGNQNRQEDYLLMATAEQKEQAEVYARRRIAGDDDAITERTGACQEKIIELA